MVEGTNTHGKENYKIHFDHVFSSSLPSENVLNQINNDFTKIPCSKFLNKLFQSFSCLASSFRLAFNMILCNQTLSYPIDISNKPSNIAIQRYAFSFTEFANNTFSYFPFCVYLTMFHTGDFTLCSFVITVVQQLS